MLRWTGDEWTLNYVLFKMNNDLCVFLTPASISYLGILCMGSSDLMTGNNPVNGNHHNHTETSFHYLPKYTLKHLRLFYRL